MNSLNPRREADTNKKTVALAIRRVALSLAIDSILSSCASQPLVDPSGPGGVIVAVDPTGVTFDQQGRDLWIRENVPASWFVATPQGFHLTSLQYHEGNQIRQKFFNN